MFILLFQLYILIIIWLMKCYPEKSLGDLHEFIGEDPYNISYYYVNRCFSGASNHMFTL